MRDVAVVIAYRDMGCEHRRRAFAHVVTWYAQHGLPVVVEAGADDDSFTRASAINAAVERSGAMVLVQSDPDSLVPEVQLHQAIALADAHDGLVIPHDRYLYLTEAATAAVLAGRDMTNVGPADCHDHGPNGSGNVVVFNRATWRRAGRLDERFGLWGGDDGALAYACDALVAPTRRLIGDMVHLYHPRLPQSYPEHPDYVAQFALLAAYRDAAAVGPDAVRALVESR